ncbi:nucleoside deaminase [Maridesulfovibrio zosterae]|uniref:nucleoside deaminase n=1 Tax=Maridesulfovibrio zosterae TaxID=82171 RepID=UPI0004168446|nr:nucleoside deaminase [Maridesulfovibrio zosterae]
MSDNDMKFMDEAYMLAKKSFDEGGLPIGAVLVRDGIIIGRGHNQRVQKGDPIAHGEMDCLRNAGRQKTYKDTVLYTTLSPCMMCSGTMVQFGVPRVVIGENRNFGGNEEFLQSNGIEVDILDHSRCIALMEELKATKPELWAEDIGE